MPFVYFSEQEKQSANASDIKSFLASQGQEVKRCGREYMWNSPSGKVSVNGSEWYSQYERVGGGAISFVQKYFGASYPDAIRSLLGNGAGQTVELPEMKTQKENRNQPIVLPEKNSDMHRLYGYLLNERCLDREVVRAFIHEGILYEDTPNHNAVFVGTDVDGNAKHVQKRSTSPSSDYKGNVVGSDIAYAFHHVGTSNKLFIFEAPIDMMAYISMNKTDWEKHSYTALCSTADCAAIRMLTTYPNIKEVFLCLDHDSAGIEGAYRVAESIHTLGDYSVWRKMPKNKDWDEDLKELHGKEAIPASEHKKLNLYQQKCSDFLLPECQQTGLWKCIADAKGYVVGNLLSLLQTEIAKIDATNDWGETQEHLKNCVIGCIAFCYCRDRQMERPSAFRSLADKLRSQYKPHKDVGNSNEQWFELKKNLALLQKTLPNHTLTESNIQDQESTVINFAMNCIRLCSAMELEQIEHPLTLNLE